MFIEKPEEVNSCRYKSRIEITKLLSLYYQVAQFKVAESREIDAMRDLIKRNDDKYHREGMDGKYCICRKMPSGFMLQCELCKDWFHSKFYNNDFILGFGAQ